MHSPAHPSANGLGAPSSPRWDYRSFSRGSAPNPSHPWHGGPEALAFPSPASLLLLIRELGAGGAARTSRGRLMRNRFPQSGRVLRAALGEAGLGWGGHTRSKPPSCSSSILQPFPHCSRGHRSPSRAGGGEQGWDPRVGVMLTPVSGLCLRKNANKRSIISTGLPRSPPSANPPSESCSHLWQQLLRARCWKGQRFISAPSPNLRRFHCPEQCWLLCSHPRSS